MVSVCPTKRGVRGGTFGDENIATVGPAVTDAGGVVEAAVGVILAGEFQTQWRFTTQGQVVLVQHVCARRHFNRVQTELRWRRNRGIARVVIAARDKFIRWSGLIRHRAGGRVVEQAVIGAVTAIESLGNDERRIGGTFDRISATGPLADGDGAAAGKERPTGGIHPQQIVDGAFGGGTVILELSRDAAPVVRGGAEYFQTLGVGLLDHANGRDSNDGLALDLLQHAVFHRAGKEAAKIEIVFHQRKVRVAAGIVVFLQPNVDVEAALLRGPAKKMVIASLDIVHIPQSLLHVVFLLIERQTHDVQTLGENPPVRVSDSCAAVRVQLLLTFAQLFVRVAEGVGKRVGAGVSLQVRGHLIAIVPAQLGYNKITGLSNPVGIQILHEVVVVLGL